MLKNRLLCCKVFTPSRHPPFKFLVYWSLRVTFEKWNIRQHVYVAVVWNNYMGMKTRQYATRKHDKKGRWLFHALSCSSFVPNFLLFIFSQHENGTQKQTGSSIQRELLCWWGLLFITWVTRMVQTVKSSLIKRKLWFHPFIISPFI